MYEIYSSPAFEEKFTYTGNDLGSTWAEAATAFRLWAPTAESACVKLYFGGTQGSDDLLERIPMRKDIAGTWIAEKEGNCDGIYYTYEVAVNGQTIESIDPYAVTAGVNGERGMVVNLSATDPEGWEGDCPPHCPENDTDCVIYELHVRDFSSHASSGIQARGKFLGLTEHGTATPAGQTTGLDYLRQLGITHVHLLPIYDYGSVDEAHPDERYNWGYDPVNFNLPEGSYATCPSNGHTRIRELKQTIQVLHNNGLGVIMDVVYNHVYHTFEFSMNKIVPGYFSREDGSGELSNGSFCGNDTASERAMVRKFIVDSVNFWADEYHMDGFRFDLVGLIDVETIQLIISTVRKKHSHVIFYGEGWDMPTQVTKPGIPLAIQNNAPMLPEFAFFNDTIRDTMRGSLFGEKKNGYVTGEVIPKEALLRCFRGQTAWSNDPRQIVNYVSCHDNHTLHDRIAEAFPDASEAEIARRSRLAAAFTLLSAGIPFFQAGEEMLRAKQDENGHYVENSYNSPDCVNSIAWERLAQEGVAKTHRYYQGLLAIRKAHRLFRLATPTETQEKITLLPDPEENITAFRLEDGEETILALYHCGSTVSPFTLPDGVWTVLAQDDQAFARGITSASGKVMLPPMAAFIAVQSK